MAFYDFEFITFENSKIMLEKRHGFDIIKAQFNNLIIGSAIYLS